VGTPRSELVRWVRRYEATERRIAAERRERRIEPDQALRLALDLMRLVEERGEDSPGRDPSEEDLGVYRVWARLRRRLGGIDD